jgi:hypothetical protein
VAHTHGDGQLPAHDPRTTVFFPHDILFGKSIAKSMSFFIPASFVPMSAFSLVPLQNSCARTKKTSRLLFLHL